MSYSTVSVSMSVYLSIFQASPVNDGPAKVSRSVRISRKGVRVFMQLFLSF